MSKNENNDKGESLQEETQNPEIGSLPLTIHAQYVRDISFENPLANQVLRSDRESPKMNINFAMDARKLEDQGTDNMYEVTLSVNAEAKSEGETVFIAEIQYGVMASVNNIPEEKRHPLLLIEIPRLAFPFVRRILSDLTMQGGYPPLLLSPVNFHKLYIERFGAAPANIDEKAEDKEPKKAKKAKKKT